MGLRSAIRRYNEWEDQQPVYFTAALCVVYGLVMALAWSYRGGEITGSLLVGLISATVILIAAEL